MRTHWPILLLVTLLLASSLALAAEAWACSDDGDGEQSGERGHAALLGVGACLPGPASSRRAPCGVEDAPSPLVAREVFRPPACI